MDRFIGRRIIVTGAGSGMGQAAALRILREGGTVTACDLSAEGLAATAKTAADEGSSERLTTAQLDVGDEARVGEVVSDAVARMGGLDVLINAAGVLRGCHTEDCTLELWEQVLRTNLTGTFLVTRAALPALLDGGGAIVNFASVAAYHASPYAAAYAASKGGVAAFTRTVALEFAKRGLRAVIIAPGGVDTPLVSAVQYPEDADMKLLLRDMPVGRAFATPDEVAGIVAMVASDEGAYLNGTVIEVDGGAHA
ncbi:MAG TPA: SDR family oxidoreductase [Acidimicrobiales bacterium]|nr:SDR family oxidoreductase [Acidimicrobiales bacterium]